MDFYLDSLLHLPYVTAKTLGASGSVAEVTI
jgi:hypothetical protein